MLFSISGEPQTIPSASAFLLLRFLRGIQSLFSESSAKGPEGGRGGGGEAPLLGALPSATEHLYADCLISLSFSFSEKELWLVPTYEGGYEMD